MQNEEVNDGKSVDYDELSHNNAAQNEMETDGFENDSINKKDKARRYWTAKEEEKFFEIWGRENWRLTRHGKNTVFFAQWSKELKERFNMDIKPEEVQAKVNQTRAKFRSVKKSIETEFITTKWKKYDIIDRILKNQYRSENDEPIPKEALENNRDFSPNSRQAPTPNSITSNSTQDTLNHSGSGYGVGALNNTSHLATDEEMAIKMEQEMPNNLYGEAPTNHTYNTDMYTEQYPRDVKTEYEDEYQNYSNYNEQMHYGNTAEPHLHQLQTPQHQQLSQQPQQQPPPPPQQQQQQPQQQQPPPAQQNPHAMYAPAPQHPAPTNIIHPQHHMTPHMNTLGPDVTQLNNSDQTQPAYEPVSNPTYTNLNDQNTYPNGSYNPNSFNSAPQPVAPVPPLSQVQNTTVPLSTNNNTMQPPRPTPCTTPLPRKRGRPLGPGNTVNNSSGPSGSSSIMNNNYSGDSLETQYMDQVRKKNIILEESREILKKRLEVEERKIRLMEDFLPKLFSLQNEILHKMSTISSHSLALLNTFNTNLNNGNAIISDNSSHSESPKPSLKITPKQSPDNSPKASRTPTPILSPNGNNSNSNIIIGVDSNDSTTEENSFANIIQEVVSNDEDMQVEEDSNNGINNNNNNSNVINNEVVNET